MIEDCFRIYCRDTPGTFMGNKIHHFYPPEEKARPQRRDSIWKQILNIEENKMGSYWNDLLKKEVINMVPGQIVLMSGTYAGIGIIVEDRKHHKYIGYNKFSTGAFDYLALTSDNGYVATLEDLKVDALIEADPYLNTAYETALRIMQQTARGACTYEDAKARLQKEACGVTWFKSKVVEKTVAELEKDLQEAGLIDKTAELKIVKEHHD